MSWPWAPLAPTAWSKPSKIGFQWTQRDAAVWFSMGR
jgi:hypothetical protein